MVNIHEKTLQDLEFHTVLEQVSEHCITSLGNEKAMQIAPFKTKEELLVALHLTNEYLSSFHNNNRIPNHGFDAITKELQLLRIDNTYLEVHSLNKIDSISLTTNEIVSFLIKFKEYYPYLNEFASHIEITNAIIEKVDSIVDRFGDIKDNASVLLYDLRQAINKIKGKINQSFTTALNTYNNLEYLDDIRESVVDNKRVLAVKAMYRRKVKGAIMGGSKTGSIVYIEPETTMQYTRELNNLEYEEQEEFYDKETGELKEEIGSRDCLKGQMASVRANEKQLYDFLQTVELDPGFKPLFKFFKGRDYPIFIVSDSFDFLIDSILFLCPLFIISNKILGISL